MADAPPGEDVKPQVGATQHLNLKVKAQDGSEVFFKVKRTTQFRKLMDAYCARMGVAGGNFRFLFDGDRLRPEQTPADCDMEDEDEIDAFREQTGGCL